LTSLVKKLLGLQRVPVIAVTGLSETERRALAVADKGAFPMAG
jgi:hypothetical protein